jgi:hypothetical protein
MIAVAVPPTVLSGGVHEPLDLFLGRGSVLSGAAVAPLDDDSLSPYHARLPEHDFSVGVLDMLRQPDASVGAGQQWYQHGATAHPLRMILRIAARRSVLFRLQSATTYPIFTFQILTGGIHGSQPRSEDFTADFGGHEVAPQIFRVVRL